MEIGKRTFDLISIESQAKSVWSHLEEIHRKGFSREKVFHDWLDLMLLGLQRRDPEYLEHIKPYVNNAEIGKRPVDQLANAFAELMLQMQQNCTDILGYMFTTEITRGENGQFFTPDTICELSAKIMIGEPVTEKPNISDPACGSGAMLIAGIKQAPNGFFCGIDVDARCCKMATLNMLFRNVNSIIIHGNTLTLEIYTAWETKRTYLGGEVRQLAEHEMHIAREWLEAPLRNSAELQEKNKEEPASNKHGQFSLF